MLHRKYKAFTIIELIIVIVIIGIVSSIFVMNIPDNNLISDKRYLVSKLYEKKNNALKYSYVNVSNNWETFNNYDNNCLNLDVREDHIVNSISQIVSEEINNELSKKYYINDNLFLNITGLNSDLSKICFDANGVPYDGDYRLENRLKQKVVIEMNYNGKVEYIYILPMTGAVIY